MRTVAQFHVGIDLHQRVIQTCVMDLRTGELIERRFRVNSLAEGLGVVDYLAGWKEKARYVVEAVGMNRWFVNACRERGMEVVVADPARLNLKMLGKKTDRHDAQELARRLGLGDIDRKARTYYPSEAEYGARKVLRVRHELKGIRQRVVNQLRAMFRAYWVEAPTGRLYTKKGLGWLEGCAMENEELTRCVRALGRLLEQVEAEIAVLTKRAGELSQEAWPRELDAIPQVGALTAVTKRGNPYLRWILGQTAVRLLARDPVVKTWAEPMLRRMHPNKVRTALARRLLVGICAARRRGEPFSMARCLSV